MQSSDAAQTIKEREAWADFIRASAIFMVVIIHVAGIWLYKPIDAYNWDFVNLVQSSMRMAVPLFFMLTGYLLLNKPLSLQDYMKRRVSRIAVPFFVWPVIIFLFRRFSFDLKLSLFGYFRLFLKGDVFWHFWFMYTLIGLYLFLPILSWMLERDETKRSVYFIVIWLISISLLPIFNDSGNYYINRVVYLMFDLAMFSGYTGFLLLGYLLGKKINITKRIFSISVVTYIAMVVLTFYLTRYYSFKTGRFYEKFYSYIAPNIVIMAAAAFIIIKKFGMMLADYTSFNKEILSVSRVSLGIYLVHPIFIAFVNDGKLGNVLANMFFEDELSIPLIAVIVFILSYSVSAIIKKIPVIRRIV